MIKIIKEDTNEQIKEIPSECIKGATLLSAEEYEKYKNNIPPIGLIDNWWWLRSPGFQSYYVYAINVYNKIYEYCYVHEPDGGIRPALILNLQSSNLNIKDKFKIGKYYFTVISNNLAICDDFISKDCFRQDVNSPDANVYEKSDVKKIVDNWFDDIILKSIGLKTSKEIFGEDDFGF